MLTRANILSLNFMKKEDFTGSYKGMRFLLRQDNIENEKKLCVYIWGEPLGFEATPDDMKLKKLFEFSNEGVDDAIKWMNENYEMIKTK
jgi:hypothetical protein